MAKSVRELLDQAKRFHHSLSELYGSVAEESLQARVKMLLAYMSRHERYLERCLADYEEETSKKLLDHWFQFPADAPLCESIVQHELKPGMPFEEVVRLVLKLDDGLVRFYRQVAEETVGEEVKELFTRLAAQMERDEHKIARAACELDQL